MSRHSRTKRWTWPPDYRYDYDGQYYDGYYDSHPSEQYYGWPRQEPGHLFRPETGMGQPVQWTVDPERCQAQVIGRL